MDWEHEQAGGDLCRLLRQFVGWTRWLQLIALALAWRRGPRGLLMKMAENERDVLCSLGEGHRGNMKTTRVI